MGIISKLYLKNFLHRYDKEVGVPYYSYQDFEGLNREDYSFKNSRGTDIRYFYYYYPNYKIDKAILFCHGLGPGHTAYLAEIETLCKRGYKVLTLDYTGSGESGGSSMISLTEPTRDAIDLLDHLKLKEEIIIMGHSLGGFTALNVINLRKELQKAVILSGFLSSSSLISSVIKNKFIVSRILKYERKINPQYSQIDNDEYLKNINDKLFFIQSIDDAIVPYSIGLGTVELINNKNIQTKKMNDRKHNPNYTDEAVKYMNEVFGKYNYLLKKKEIKTDAQKIEYFKDVSIAKLTEQDQSLFDEIINFIN